MDTSEIVRRELGEGAEESRCLWQLAPRELPADAPCMALEMWQDAKGLVFFQFFVKQECRTDARWWDAIDSYTVFREARLAG